MPAKQVHKYDIRALETMYGLWSDIQLTPQSDTLDEQEKASRPRQTLLGRTIGTNADMPQDTLGAYDTQP